MITVRERARLGRHAQEKGVLVKIVGLVGGTGWISTADYYRYINQEANRRLGGLHFIECILYSLDYGEIDELKRTGREPEVYHLILNAARKLESAGAKGLVLCANTMHKFVEKLEQEISIPIVHIADATGREIVSKRLRTVGLLGTRLTMELDFYKKRLQAMGIGTIVPEPEDREYIEQAINTELLKGVLKPETKNGFLQIIDDLREKGAEGIVLGCTEIPLIVQEKDVDLPVFNTTLIHSRAIVDFALGEK
jgi:aspartate racemase